MALALLGMPNDDKLKRGYSCSPVIFTGITNDHRGSRARRFSGR